MCELLWAQTVESSAALCTQLPDSCKLMGEVSCAHLGEFGVFSQLCMCELLREHSVGNCALPCTQLPAS